MGHLSRCLINKSNPRQNGSLIQGHYRAKRNKISMGEERRVHCYAIICVLACHWLLVSCQSTTLESGPQNKTVFAGERVTFTCDFNNDNDKNILWTKSFPNGHRRYISFNDYIYPNRNIDQSNYRVVIDSSKQKFRLVIKRVHASIDAGKYDCGYEVGQNRKYQPAATAYLKVLPKPKYHSCQYANLPVIDPNPNHEVELMCSWSGNQTSNAELRSNDQLVATDVESSDRIISRVVVSPGNETPNFTCSFTINNDGDLMNMSTSCSNSYDSDTSGIVRVDPFVNEVTLGSTASFRCSTGGQSFIFNQTWTMINNEQGYLLSEGRQVESPNQMDILDVHAKDEVLLVECRANLVGEIKSVASYAAIRIVESTTTMSRRPPNSIVTGPFGGSSVSPSNTVDFVVTSSITPSNQNTVPIIVALVIIILLITIIVAIVFIVKRKAKSRHIKYTSGTHINNNPVINYDSELQDIPHTTPNGSTNIYALSFKDKRARQHQSMDFDVDREPVRFEVSQSKSCGSLHMQSETPTDVVYAMPDVDFKSRQQSDDATLDSRRKVAKSLSLPLLDTNEYETMSVSSSESITKAQTLSANMSLSNPSDHRRWMSQRQRKDALRTPPRARHALSFRKPAKADPNVHNDYTKMTIKHTSSVDDMDRLHAPAVPVYAQSTKRKTRCKSDERISPDGSMSNLDDGGREYADIVKVMEKPVHGDKKELVDTYLSSIPGPMYTTPGFHKNKKTTSLQRAHPMTQTPPKPSRGKCQSELVQTAAYSSISDYEIMANQIGVIRDDDDYAECDDNMTSARADDDYAECDDNMTSIRTDDDYAECDDNARSVCVVEYDKIPKRFIVPKTPNLLPDITESGFKGTHQSKENSNSQNDYEFIDSKGGSGERHITVDVSEESQQYADICDVMHATVDKKS